MRCTIHPLCVRDGPVHEHGTMLNGQHGLNVMLVHITVRDAEPPKLSVILHVCDDLHCEFPRDLKPLGALPPLLKADLGHHARRVPPSPVHAWVIKHLYVAVRNAGERGVDVAEIIQGNATFRQQNEALICRL